jgi:outer membrane protein insertion porin family
LKALGRFLHIYILLLLLLVLSACSTTKPLAPHQQLLCKVNINGIKNNNIEESARAFVQQEPNTKFFFFFRFNLYINQRLANKKPNSLLGKIRNNLGEEAIIIDSLSTFASAQQINQFLISKGYFDNVVRDSMVAYGRKDKKVKLYYNCELGKATTIDSLSFQFKDPNLESIFKTNYSVLNVQIGDRYDIDEFSKQIERFYNLYKNHGYYDFLRQYISIMADTLDKDHQVSLSFIFENPDNGNHLQYNIDSIHIKVDDFTQSDSNIRTDGLYYDYTDPSKKFNPGTFQKLCFLQPRSLYNQENVNLTFNRMGDLGVFKFVNIEFNKKDSNLLDCDVKLNTRKQYALKPEAEGTFNNGYLGANTSLNFTNRNLFKGAERFELGVKGGIESQRSILQREVENNFTRRNLTINSNIYIPKLLLPFFKPNYKIANPQTFFSLSFAYDKRDNLYFRRTITNAFGYDWKDTRTKSHYLKLVDVNVVNSSISNTLESALLSQNNFYILRSFIPYFSIGTQYRYTDNRIADLLTTNKAFYFKFTLDVVGNSLNAVKDVFQFAKDSTGASTVFGLVYYQFTRPEIELRYYTKINENQQIVTRFNSGIGLTYGNTQVLPFDKQFFVGGSNSLRGWQARRLGPGSYSTLNDSTFNRLFFDQTGDFKLEFNTEYRFTISKQFFGSSLNGAVFGDAGNVWFVRTNTGLDGGTFYINNLLRDIAFNTGLGLRFDYGFFIFRLDLGIKLKDPSVRGIRNGKWLGTTLHF